MPPSNPLTAKRLNKNGIRNRSFAAFIAKDTAFRWRYVRFYNGAIENNMAKKRLRQNCGHPLRR